MKILICGFGNIGQHLKSEFEQGNEITIYDKYKTDYSDKGVLDLFYDAAFISVPTEMKKSGEADLSEVFEIIRQIKASVIIIRSTIPVGTCDKLYEMGCLNIVFCPEHYGMTQHALKNPNFAIIGGSPRNRNLAAKVFMSVKSADFRFIFTDTRTAELSKYMLNTFLALKVTFCNEFASLAQALDVNYNQLRECFIQDDRINPSHTFVYPDKPYYDSHCFNKDIPALIYQARDAGIEIPITEAMDKENKRRKRPF